MIMMPISLMKLIDENLGRVTVFFLKLFKKIFKSISKDKKASTVNNILLIKFWGIGSIILTTPAANVIKKIYPSSKIYFLTLSDNLEICRLICSIDEVITIRLTNPFHFICDFIKNIFRLRKIDFDLVFDFEFYTYFSTITVALIKSKISIGFDNRNSNRNSLFTKTVLFNDSIHTKDNFLQLATNNFYDYEFVLPDLKTHFPKFKLSQHLYPFFKNEIPKIIINPNASKLAYERRLPKETFLKIINSISKNFNVNIIIIGSEEEINYVNEIYELVNEKNTVSNLCGRLTIKELIILIKSSSCLITNDSGPLHIASALDIPSVSFFGPESPKRYGPLSKQNLVFYNNLQCSPCMSISNSKTVNCIYDSPKCMELFETANIINKVNLFLNDILNNESETERSDATMSEDMILQRILS